MKYTVSQMLTKYSEANTIKMSWDTEYREIFDYCMPARNGYDKAFQSEKINPEFQDRRENLFDSTGEQAATEFVNTMQDTLAPPASNFIDLEAGSRYAEEDREDVNTELDKLCTQANEYKNNSSFDVAFSEFCYDVFAGTGCLCITAGTPDRPLAVKAIPLREYCIEEGINGEVVAVYRSYSVKRELLPFKWKELRKMKVAKADAKKDVNIVECSYYNYDLMVWHYVVINKDSQQKLLERDSKTPPFIVLRWSKTADEPYGRGPGLTALNDIKTLNLVKEYGLRNLAYAIPPLLASDDATIDVDNLDFTPMAVNIVSDPDADIKPLALATDHDFTNFKVQELQMDIKKNTFGDTLPNEGSRNLTATEIRARKMDMRKNLNSVYGRIQTEFQQPLIRRIFDVLMETGAIKVPDEFKELFNVNKIDGFIFKVKINTPLSRQLAYGEANAILGAVSTLNEFDPTGETTNDYLKIEELGPHLMGLLGVPNRFIKTPEEVKQTQTQTTEAKVAANNTAIQNDVDSSNAKEVGKVQAQKVEDAA